jgi:RNA recognition motif-containing protein
MPRCLPTAAAVGNLPFETTEAELHTHLSQIGPIKNLR